MAERPREKPEYKVYRSRRRLRDRIRKPDLSRPAAGGRRRRAQAAEAALDAGRRRRAAAVATGAVVGRDRRPSPGSRSASSPSRSRPRSRSRSSPTASPTSSTATRSCSPSRRRSSSSAPTCGRAPSPAPTRRSRSSASRRSSAAGARTRAAATPRSGRTRSCSSASGRRRVPQALDPARHARRDPGLRGREDQLRLRARRREARGPHGRGPARDRRRPGRDHRLRRLPPTSSTRSAGSTSTCRPTSARTSRAAPSSSTSSAGENHLDGFQAITLARTRTNTCGSGQFTGTDVERAQFQQLILDGIKGQMTSITALPDELPQAAR